MLEVFDKIDPYKSTTISLGRPKRGGRTAGRRMRHTWMRPWCSGYSGPRTAGCSLWTGAPPAARITGIWLHSGAPDMFVQNTVDLMKQMQEVPLVEL